MIYYGISKTVAIALTVIIIAAIAGGLYYYNLSTQPAAKWPSKPITFIVPFGAGGGTDRTARYMAALLENMTGWKVVVENKPGGGGAC